MHTLDAEGLRIVHLAFCLCAHAHYCVKKNTLKQGALAGCTGSKMCAPCSQIVQAYLSILCHMWNKQHFM